MCVYVCAYCIRLCICVLCMYVHIYMFYVLYLHNNIYISYSLPNYIWYIRNIFVLQLLRDQKSVILTSNSITWIFFFIKKTCPYCVFSQRQDIGTLGGGCLCFFLSREAWQLLPGEELGLFKFLLGYGIWNLESRH